MTTYTLSTTTKTITYTSPEVEPWDNTYTLTHEVEGPHHILTCGREQLRLTYPEAAMWIAQQWEQQTSQYGVDTLRGFEILWCNHQQEVLQERARQLVATRDYSTIGEWLGFAEGDEDQDPTYTGIHRYERELVAALMTGDGYELVPMSDLLSDALELDSDEADALAAELFEGWVASTK